MLRGRAAGAGRRRASLWWFLVPPLLLAGLGGGGVISPELHADAWPRCRPRWAARPAGRSRPGSGSAPAIGAALLMTVYQVAWRARPPPSRAALRAGTRSTALVVLGHGALGRARWPTSPACVRGSRRASTPRPRGAGRPPRRPGGTPPATCATAAPVKAIGSATSASSCVAVRPSRSSAASRSNRSLSAWPWRMSRATPTACLLDRLVRGLAADAVADRRHQHLGGGQERQVAVELALDHRREGAELVEHGEEGLEQPVGGEERVGQRHPAYDRAGDVALVPLVAGELADHRQVAAGDHGQAVDPLAGAGVHLVRHRATSRPGPPRSPR